MVRRMEWSFGLLCGFLACLSMVGCARLRARYAGGVPPDPNQVESARNEARFNNFLHDATGVQGGSVDPNGIR
jgi:hypothetical protein